MHRALKTRPPGQYSCFLRSTCLPHLGGTHNPTLFHFQRFVHFLCTRVDDKMPVGALEVLVLEAKGIKDTELFGKGDPYAILTCGQMKLRTTTAKDQGSHPVWNQKLLFNIDEGTHELIIRIYNENVIDDDYLGSTTIPLAKVFNSGKVPATFYSVIRPSGRTKGEVKLELTFASKGSHGKGSDGSANSAGSHGAPCPPPPYGSIDRYGTQHPNYEKASQHTGAYPLEKTSNYPPNSYPSSPYPPRPSTSHNLEWTHAASYPGYPPPPNIPSAYPSSAYPPALPSHAYKPQQSDHADYSVYPNPASIPSAYPPPPAQYGGTTDQYKGNMPYEATPWVPHSPPLAADFPVKRMEELSLGPKPPKYKHDPSYPSPVYSSTENVMAGKEHSKDNPGKSYPPDGYAVAGESPSLSYPPAGYPPAVTSVESRNPGMEKRQDSFNSPHSAYPQAPYREGSFQHTLSGYPVPGDQDGGKYGGKSGKSEEAKKHDSFDTPAAYLPAPYQGESFQSASTGYPLSSGHYGVKHEGGKPGKSQEEIQDASVSAHYGANTSYPPAPYQEGSFQYAASGYCVSGDHHAGKHKEEKGHESVHGGYGAIPAYAPAPYQGGSQYALSGYPGSGSGDLHGWKNDEGSHGKNEEEKKLYSVDGHYGATTVYSPEPYQGESFQYCPSRYPVPSSPHGVKHEIGKPGKNKDETKQDSFGCHYGANTSYPPASYQEGYFQHAPSGYHVSGDHHEGKHKADKPKKNKEEKKHDSIDGHYGAIPEYAPVPYKEGSFQYAASGYPDSDDHRGGKHEEGKHGKNKEEKKYGSFDGYHASPTGYPPAPHLSGSSHYIPGGYPVSGYHYEGKHGEAKHGKYKEEKHGKHRKHGKHGKFKGFKGKW